MGWVGSSFSEFGSGSGDISVSGQSVQHWSGMHFKKLSRACRSRKKNTNRIYYLKNKNEKIRAEGISSTSHSSGRLASIFLWRPFASARYGSFSNKEKSCHDCSSAGHLVERYWWPFTDSFRALQETAPFLAQPFTRFEAQTWAVPQRYMMNLKTIQEK